MIADDLREWSRTWPFVFGQAMAAVIVGPLDWTGLALMTLLLYVLDRYMKWRKNP